VPVQDKLETGTSRVSQPLLDRVGPFDLSALVAYQPEFLAGWQAQGCDVGLQAAWDQARVEMRDQAKSACRDDIPSAHVRNLSVAADFEDEVWRYVLLPLYLSSYRFGGQPYQLLINGQTGAVAGQKPLAWAKVWLVVAGLLAPGAVLGLLGLPLTLAGGLGAGLMVIGGVLFVIGLVISAWILSQAMKAGEA
jgi:hypothetical protein